MSTLRPKVYLFIKWMKVNVSVKNCSWSVHVPCSPWDTEQCWYQLADERISNLMCIYKVKIIFNEKKKYMKNITKGVRFKAVPVDTR